MYLHTRSWNVLGVYSFGKAILTIVANTQCSTCNRTIKKSNRAIECDICFQWYHFKCKLISSKQFNQISITGELWLCQRYRDITFPFNTIDAPELIDMTYNSRDNFRIEAYWVLLELGLGLAIEKIDEIFMHKLSA